MLIIPGRVVLSAVNVLFIHSAVLRSVTTVVCHIARINFTLTSVCVDEPLKPWSQRPSDSTHLNSTGQLSWDLSVRRCEQSFTHLKRTTGRVLAGRAFRDNATLRLYNDVIVIGMNFSPLFLVKCHTKLIFRIFHIWQINGLAPCWNLFIKRPSHYSLTTVLFIYLFNTTKYHFSCSKQSWQFGPKISMSRKRLLHILSLYLEFRYCCVN